MKVFDLIETTEWDNNPETRKSLFRVQQARCHELLIYINHLNGKYDSINLRPLMDMQIRDATAMATTLSRSLFSPEIPKHEKHKYTAKYDRMIHAKIAYENAGGEYE